MVVAVPVYDKSDPKSDKFFAYHLPASDDWEEQRDLFGSALMMMAGGGMFMKSPLIIWTAMVLAVSSYVTSEQMRRKPDSASPLATLGMAISGVIATSMPKILLAPEVDAAAAAAAATAAASATTSS